ncbi:MAG: hypothetical protein DDT35_00432 [Firmicutes bacterium]|nr:hypothetical protein [Bacillota bacterium]
MVAAEIDDIKEPVDDKVGDLLSPKVIEHQHLGLPGGRHDARFGVTSTFSAKGLLDGGDEVAEDHIQSGDARCQQTVTDGA